MKYIALLRGINVGGKRKVDMRILKSLFESMGYKNVQTYLNSGNVLFHSEEFQEKIQDDVAKALFIELGFEIPVLIKSKDEMKFISDNIPDDWRNNEEQKIDVAYLFSEIDSEEIADSIPVKKEYIDVIYVKGAIIWHVHRKNYNRSQLNKLVGTEIINL